MHAATRLILRMLIAIPCLAFLCLPTAPNLHAQTAPAPAAAAIALPATIALNGTAGETASITAAELARLPHRTITVFNGHTSRQESYSGVLLSDLLARVNAPLGDKLHGKAMTTRVIAEGADHYMALYSLAEIDPAFHPGSVIIADSMDGEPLPTKQGPLQLVNTEDKRPARWVRQLVAVRLVGGD